jgi:transcriptional regulator with XRE-family HTH domain
MEYAKRVRALRELKGYTQKRMAIELGITQSRYSIIENHAAQCKLETLLKVSEILEIPIHTMLDLSQPVHEGMFVVAYRTKK